VIANKKLGLLLLPLVPLSAIGIVSLVNRALPSTPVLVECPPTREAPHPPRPPAVTDLNPLPA
jgi:hypothetical protein